MLPIYFPLSPCSTYIAAVGAFAAVESANVVGYQNKELNEKANSFVVQTLLPCGVTKADVTLADFLPTDGEDGWDYARDYVATLKVNGTLDKKYGYLSPYWEKEYYEAGQSGWYDYAVLQPDPDEIEAEKVPDTVTFGAGEGFLVYTSGAGIELVVPSAL